MKRESLIVSCLLCMGLALTGAPARAGIENIIGKWNAKAVTPNGPIELELEIKAEGTELVGTLAGFQGTVPLSNLKFEDPNLSLEVTLAGSTFKLIGILKDGKFDGKYEQVGTDFKGAWTAERKVASAPAMTASSISGSWNSIAVTPNGDLAMRLDLKQDAETLTGTLGSEMGTIPIQAASFKENKLQFNVDIGGTMYRVEANLADDKFSGQWSAVGGTDTGAWNATRKLASPVPAVASSATNLDGVWTSTAATPDGNSIIFDLELKQAGDSLTGNAIAPEGKIPLQKGSFTKNVLSFEIEYAGATYRIQAELASGKLTGKWSALNSPDTGAWSAARKSQ